jgi:hypothetical protein
MNNEYALPFARLNDEQRQQAIRLATKAGLPNCIGLRFFVGPDGNLLQNFINPYALDAAPKKI